MLVSLFIIFGLLVLLGTPIAFTLGLASLGALSTQDTIPLLVVVQRFFTALDSFSLIAIPLFMLTGVLMNETGMISKLVRFAVSIVGHIRGGFAQVNVMANVLLAGISGSASADAAATGSILIPAMKKERYDPGFAVALTAAAATIGPIIPPSIMMIIYGSMSGVSIGELFIAGIIPGILLGITFMIYSYFYAKKHKIAVSHQQPSRKEIWNGFKDAIWVLVLPFVIIGGIRFGFFSPTEAGSIAVGYAFLLGLVTKTLSIKRLPKVFVEAAVLSTISLMIIAAAAAFGWILASQQFPAIVVETLTSISENPLVVMLITIGVLLFIGLFLEGSAAVIILIPVLMGIQQNFNFEPVHFGVLVIITLVVGGITPPVGNLLFISASIGKVQMSEVVWKIWPLVGVMLIVIIILVLFPGLVTFLL